MTRRACLTGRATKDTSGSRPMGTPSLRPSTTTGFPFQPPLRQPPECLSVLDCRNSCIRRALLAGVHSEQSEGKGSPSWHINTGKIILQDFLAWMDSQWQAGMPESCNSLLSTHNSEVVVVCCAGGWLDVRMHLQHPAALGHLSKHKLTFSTHRQT